MEQLDICLVFSGGEIALLTCEDAVWFVW